MKKLLIVAAALMIGASSYGQQKVCPANVATVKIGGEFNSSTVAGGTATTSTSTTPTAQSTFPLYTKLDTVTNTGADTFQLKLQDEVNSLYIWGHATSISGTNTSCTIKLQVSSDAGAGTDWITLKTATVSSTGNPYIDTAINNGIGWIYTNARLIFTGVGTHSTSWYGGVMVRYTWNDQWAVDNRRRSGWINEDEQE